MVTKIEGNMDYSYFINPFSSRRRPALTRELSKFFIAYNFILLVIVLLISYFSIFFCYSFNIFVNYAKESIIFFKFSVILYL